MKKIIFTAVLSVLLLIPAIVTGEEFPIICELKEVLNFRKPVQIIFLRVDMKKKTVNGIASEVLGQDIISYETEAEAVTIIMPTMDISVVRKGKGPDNSDVRYTGICYHDRVIY